MNLSSIIKSLKRLTSRKYYCPLCDGKYEFSPLPDYYRQQAQLHGYIHFGKAEMTRLDTYSCTHCGASDRERLYAYWILDQMKLGALTKETRFLHFAPEGPLEKFLRGLAFKVYETADLLMAHADHKVDLMALPFKSGTYDFVLCSHVLEHVDDDRIALRELKRVLVPGGRGILMAPISLAIDKTHEDPSIVSEEGRWKHFGQNDHVRLYAHNDYVARICESGFKLTELGASHFGNELFREMGLKDTSILYVVENPSHES